MAMSNPEKEPFVAPEIFDRQYKPSWLAERFGQLARDMLSADLATYNKGIVKAREGKGPTIQFSDEGWVQEVSFRCSREKEVIHYQIKFTPGEENRGTYPDDGSVAYFSICNYHLFSKDRPIKEFARISLEPGDTDVNEFFRDLADAIDPTNVRDSI